MVAQRHATVYARCFIAIQKRQRRLRLLAPGGQMHGTVLLDEQGELVEDRALLWNDKRSQPQVDAFIAREGREKWLAHLNNPPAAAWPAFKLVWWREHHPERWPQLAKVLMPKDYINFMLTGAMATDYSEASCYFLMDSETRSWSSQAWRNVWSAGRSAPGA